MGSTGLVRSQLHVEDLGWPRKSSGEPITAKTTNVAVDFALNVAENIRTSMAVAIVA